MRYGVDLGLGKMIVVAVVVIVVVVVVVDGIIIFRKESWAASF